MALSDADETTADITALKGLLLHLLKKLHEYDPDWLESWSVATNQLHEQEKLRSGQPDHEMRLRILETQAFLLQNAYGDEEDD